MYWLEEDPYKSDLPPTTTGVRVDQSDAARRERERRHLTNVIDVLSRNALIRAGAEAAEDRDLRNYRLGQGGHRTVRKIVRALAFMRDHHFRDYDRLPAPSSLLVLENLISGRIEPP